MTKEFNSNTFASDYRDDYEKEKNFHKILFNSGKPLQARELTQLQTIIHEEIARFGGHVFKEGASLDATVPSTVVRDFVKIEPFGGPVSPNVVGKEFSVFTNSVDTGIRVKVLSYIEGTDPATDEIIFYIDYTSSPTEDPAIDTSTPTLIAPGSTLSASGSIDYTVMSGTQEEVTGEGLFAKIETGIFFAQGYFVYTPSQEINVSKYTKDITTKLGFLVNQDIVTVEDDISLYDNQGETYNLSSPGADRYRIRLELTTEDDVRIQAPLNKTFIDIATIKDGIIAEHTLSQSGEIYNKLGDSLARRTKEESGNYIVDKFILSFDDNDTKVNFNVDPGIAYVNGYRVETKSNTIIEVDKPRDTQLLSNEGVSINYGNYILATSTDGVDAGLPNIDTNQNFFLMDAQGNRIGTTRIRGVQKDGNYYRVYLMDFLTYPNRSENDLHQIAALEPSGQEESMFTKVPGTGRRDISSNNLIFPLPRTRVNEISNVTYTAQRRERVTAGQAGGVTTISLPTLSGGETYANQFGWIVAASDDLDPNNKTAIITDITVTLTNNNINASITSPGDSLVNGEDYEIILYVNKDSSGTATQSRTKTKRYFKRLYQNLDIANNKTIMMPLADGIAIDQIIVPDEIVNGGVPVDSNGKMIGKDYSQFFTFDGGQRDDHYGYSSVTANSSLNELTDNNGDVQTYIAIGFYYYEHGEGDYFDKSSYPLNEEVPSYTAANGNIYRLSDVIDFRPAVKFDFEEDDLSTIAQRYNAPAIINELPISGSSLSITADYYKAKNVKLVINEAGELIVLEGESSLEPKMPVTPDDCLELYLVEMAPFMYTADDLAVTQVESKRYTMRDIGRLEQRLERLEELTSLNMLEMATSTFTVLDNTGQIRSKTGFFVDNFMDQSRSDLTNPDYSAAIDPSRGILRPSSDVDAIKMVYDNSASSNTVLKGDNLYLSYSEVSYIKQDKVTTFENVNPYAVVTKRGMISLSPQSDSWMETKYLADRVVKGDDKFSTDQNTLWDNWNWNWSGNEQVGTTLGAQTTGTSTEWNRTTRGEELSRQNGVVTFETTQTGVRTVNTAAAVVTGFSTVNEEIGDRLISRTLLPKMRSRKINFEAKALKPNTRYFPFFGGKDVSDWVKIYKDTNNNASSFTFMASETEDYSKGYNNITEHPEGKTDVIMSDAYGNITGSFFLPMTDVISFKAGEKEFKLLDISVNEPDNATSYAASTYRSRGRLNTRQRSILSTRTVHIGTETTTERTNVLRRGTETADIPRRRRGRGLFAVAVGAMLFFDPLAQTFTVNESFGVMLTGVKINFKSKATDNKPVFVEIRPTVNGYPSASEAVPGTTVQMNPDQINISSDGSVQTTFEFDEPAYLMGGGTEYCIVVISDSNEYEIAVAEAGAFEYGSTEKRVSSQPTLGSLFKSQNARTWEPDQTKDMTFELMRAKFNIDSPASAVLKNAKNSEDVIYNIGMFTAENVMPDGTLLTQEARFKRNSLGVTEPDSYINTDLDKNIFFNQEYVCTTSVSDTLSDASVYLKLNLSSVSDFISPVIDMQRVNFAMIKNNINNDYNNPISEHVTRVTTLADTAVDLKILLSAHKPEECDFKIYYRTNYVSSDYTTSGGVDVEGTGTNSIFTNEWIELPHDGILPPPDDNPNNYREYRYITDLQDISNPEIVTFDQFQVKIVMTSSNTSKVPMFKDLRVIALYD